MTNTEMMQGVTSNRASGKKQKTHTTQLARTITRADLCEVLYEQIGLSRNEAAVMIENILDIVAVELAQGTTVKLSSFGTFSVREKGERVGRNPKTNQEVPISPRQVVVFRASQVLKEAVSRHTQQAAKAASVPSPPPQRPKRNKL